MKWRENIDGIITAINIIFWIANIIEPVPFWAQDVPKINTEYIAAAKAGKSCQRKRVIHKTKALVHH